MQDSARRFYFPEFLTSYKKNKKWREKFHVLLSISRTGKKAMLQNMIKSVCPGEIRLQSPAYRLPLAHSVTPILFTSLFSLHFWLPFLAVRLKLGPLTQLLSSCLWLIFDFQIHANVWLSLQAIYTGVFISSPTVVTNKPCPELYLRLSLAVFNTGTFVWNSKILGVQLNLDVP